MLASTISLSRLFHHITSRHCTQSNTYTLQAAACLSFRGVSWLRHEDTICLTLCLFFFSGGQVAKLYRDASLGNVVNIIVTRLIVLTEDQVRKLTQMPSCLLTDLYYCFNLRTRQAQANGSIYLGLLGCKVISLIRHRVTIRPSLAHFLKWLTGLSPLCSPTWR